MGINVKPWNLIVTYTNLSVKTETMGGCMKIISRPADGKKKEQNEFKTQMGHKCTGKKDAKLMSSSINPFIL